MTLICQLKCLKSPSPWSFVQKCIINRKSGMWVYDIVGLRHCQLHFLLSIFAIHNSKRIRTRVSIQKELALLLLRITVKDLSFEMKLICFSKTKNYRQKYLRKIKSNYSVYLSFKDKPTRSCRTGSREIDVQKTFNSQKENDNQNIKWKQ